MFFVAHWNLTPWLSSIPSQVSSVARTHLRALTALRAVTDWLSRGAASLHSAVCSGCLRTTASTRKTTPLPCTATSPRAPSKTTSGSAQISARINLSFQRRRWQDTQVWCHSLYIIIFLHQVPTLRSAAAFCGPFSQNTFFKCHSRKRTR